MGDGRAYLGQVVTEHFAGIYVVVFDLVVGGVDPGQDSLDELATASPLFAALTLSSHLDRGSWRVAGRASVAAERFLPAYKITSGDPVRFFVEDFPGARRRSATPLEIETVPFRTTSSPAYLDRAVAAREGLTPWLPALDRVRADGVILATDLFR